MPHSETRQLLPFMTMAPPVGVSTVRTSGVTIGGARDTDGTGSPNVFFWCVSVDLYTRYKKRNLIIALSVQSVLLAIGLILSLVSTNHSLMFEANDGFLIMLITVAATLAVSFVELAVYATSYDRVLKRKKLQRWRVAVYLIGTVLKLWLTGISTQCAIWVISEPWSSLPKVQEAVDLLTAASVVNALFGLVATAFSAALFLASCAQRMA